MEDCVSIFVCGNEMYTKRNTWSRGWELKPKNTADFSCLVGANNRPHFVLNQLYRFASDLCDDYFQLFSTKLCHRFRCYFLFWFVCCWLAFFPLLRRFAYLIFCIHSDILSCGWHFFERSINVALNIGRFFALMPVHMISLSLLLLLALSFSLADLFVS